MRLKNAVSSNKIRIAFLQKTTYLPTKRKIKCFANTPPEIQIFSEIIHYSVIRIVKPVSKPLNSHTLRTSAGKSLVCNKNCKTPGSVFIKNQRVTPSDKQRQFLENSVFTLKIKENKLKLNP